MNPGLYPNPQPAPWRGPELAVPGAAGLTTLAHPLGRVPATVTWHLVCKATDLGYRPGEVVPLTNGSYTTMATAADAGLIQSGAITIFQRNNPTAAAAGITASKWRLFAVLT